MATTQVFYPHGIFIENGAADIEIAQLVDLSEAYNFQDFVEFAAGQTGPQWTGSLSSTPAVPFQTRQIETMLDMFLLQYATPPEKEIVAFAPSGNVDIYYQKGENFGLRTASATVEHEKATLNSPLIWWSGLNAAQGQAAAMTATIQPVFASATNPLVVAQSALAVTSQVTEIFTLGKASVTVSGPTTIVIDALQSLSVANNVQLDLVVDSGEAYPTFAAVARYSPVVTMRCRDGAQFRSLAGITGKALDGSTGLVFYLREATKSGLITADGSSVHVKGQATTGTVKVRRIDNRGTIEIVVFCEKSDENTAAIVWSTDQIIT